MTNMSFLLQRSRITRTRKISCLHAFLHQPFEVLHLSSPNQSLMETLISENLLCNVNPSLSPSFSRFNFRSNAPKTRFFSQFSHRKWRLDSKTPNFCAITASSSSNYGGWDDFKLVEQSNHSGKFDRVHSFLVSVGVDDKKHFFMFILGLVSAFAISRVRVSAIIVFPASVLVFAVGFSLGFVRGGGVGFSVKEVSRNGSKKSSKELNVKISDDKLKSLVEFFNELDVKISNLQKEMKGAMDSNFIQVGELDSYQNVIKTISLDIEREKNLMEASISDMGRQTVDDREAERSSSQKLSKRKRDPGASFFELFPFIGGLFQANSFGWKTNKVKDIVKKESAEPLNSKMASNQIEANTVVNGTGEKMGSTPMSDNSNIGNGTLGTSPRGPGLGSNHPASNQHEAKTFGYRTGTREDMGYGRSREAFRNDRRPPNNDYYQPSNDLDFKNHNYFKNMEEPHDSFCDALDDGFDIRSRGTERGSTKEVKDYLREEDTLKLDDAFKPQNRMRDGYGPNKFDMRGRMQESEDHFNFGNQRIGSDVEMGSTSSSSMISADVLFDRNLTEATNLLKQARMCLKSNTDEDKAEVILYKSAKLLSKAISMKPMSLLAVGQLGNTFLVHGELKLKISRDLRTILSTGDPTAMESMRKVVLKGLGDQILNKDRVASVLVDVCEECEDLLVEAGRKYKTALSIDGNDVRALYNWGLALSYRAQLIADIGPEAAFDADKVFMAAIDKFDAMMSKSNAYAPDALFRWGMALQQRSQLRPSNSKEKLKLLHQAKRLFEDALSMDSNNLQVRQALSSCMSELSYRNF